MGTLVISPAADIAHGLSRWATHFALILFLPALQAQALDCTPVPRADPSYVFTDPETDVQGVPQGTTIGTIRINRLPIFNEADPAENHPLFRWANRFHLLTREKTIQEQLLFTEGQPYDAQRISESARLLRTRRFLYDAAIRPVSLCDDTVDIEVISKDVWSFTPELSLNRTGGKSSHRFGVRDTNIFGTGRFVSLISKRSLDRNSVKLAYEDKNLTRHRLGARVDFTDSDDGLTRLFQLQRPFYSLDTHYAWRVHFETDQREENQYFRGEEISRINQKRRNIEVNFGVSRGLVAGRSQRWTWGYRYTQDRFVSTTELPPPNPFPTAKTLSYPFLRYATVEDHYATAFNLNQIYRTEDLHLGLNLSATLGYSSRSLNADANRWIIEGSLKDTLYYSERTLLQYKLDWEGQWNPDTQKAEDLILAYQLSYFRSQTEHRAFFAKLDAAYSRNLNSHRQIILGAETGARAFDNRFQTGDRRLLLTVEQRQYTQVHLLNLIRLGFAVFVDAGRAWAPGEDNGSSNAWLLNAGLGIRLASTKAGAGSIVHFDFAIPLSRRDDPAVDNLQISFNIKNRF